MIALPLFAVYILDLQISANKFSAGQQQHEKPHMTQITSLDNSIWKVEV